MAFVIDTPGGQKRINDPHKLVYKQRKSKVKKLLNKYKLYTDFYIKSPATKKFLFNCANFLLLGEKADINSYYKQKTIRRREIPLTSIKNKNVYDYVYSSNESSEDGDLNVDFEQIDQPFIEYEKMLENEFFVYTRSPKLEKQWKDSRTHKLNLLYSCDDKFEYITDNAVKILKFDDNEELNKYINNTPKFIGDVKHKKVKVHNKRNGIIDPEKKIVVKWVLPNAENVFEFNNKMFYIDGLDTYMTYDFDSNTQSEMNYVLCIFVEDDNKYYFFDENIDNISHFVKQLNN